jgi:hypothetical protein
LLVRWFRWFCAEGPYFSPRFASPL